MNWETTEVKAVDFIKTSFDPTAYLIGGADSTKSDIFSPKYGCYIEVKDLSQGARFGQYTNSTLDKCKEYLEQGLDVFVNHWYKNKGVEYFCIFSYGSFSLISREDFIKSRANDFYIQSYAKWSGTRKPSKRAVDIFSKFYSIEKIEDRMYCYELAAKSYHRIGGYTFFINAKQEIRLCSNTCNITYHICLDK